VVPQTDAGVGRLHRGTLDAAGLELLVRHGGDGPPVLLLHGHPARQPPGTGSRLDSPGAGLTIDYRDDCADRAAGRRLTQPLLASWSLRDDLEELYGDPLAIWQDWAADRVTGHGIDSAHHIAEEAPAQFADALLPAFPALVKVTRPKPTNLVRRGCWQF
jgi:hypothetical protein